MSLNSILYLSSFVKKKFQFCKTNKTLDKFIFCLSSFDTLQVLMFVYSAISELRLYRYCHSCYNILLKELSELKPV